MPHQGEIRTGIAGWIFPDWRGTFYPEGLPQKNELAFASAKLRSIEINSTFYSNQKPSSFANWAEQAAEDFVFTVKGPKFITHTLKLKNAATPLANFFASGPLRLGPKLGPFVWQLPAPFGFDAGRIEEFLALLPQTPPAAAELAQKHDSHIKEPAYTGTEGVTKIRHAVEARDKSFANPDFVALLRRYNVALVCADTEGWPYRDVTADFVYARLQGPAAGHRRGYDEADLDRWASEIGRWAAGEGASEGPLLAPPAGKSGPRDAFVFFVHEDKVHAPQNAQALLARLTA